MSINTRRKAEYFKNVDNVQKAVTSEMENQLKKLQNSLRSEQMRCQNLERENKQVYRDILRLNVKNKILNFQVEKQSLAKTLRGKQAAKVNRIVKVDKYAELGEDYSNRVLEKGVFFMKNNFM